jgi:hypothetical protein
MGFVNIETGGSFPTRRKAFGAIDHGHAHAVAEAIAWLSTEVLPAAVEQDHRLHERGAKPRHGFDRPHTMPGANGPIPTPTLQDPDGGRRGD